MENKLSVKSGSTDNSTQTADNVVNDEHNASNSRIASEQHDATEVLIAERITETFNKGVNSDSTGENGPVTTGMTKMGNTRLYRSPSSGIIRRLTVGHEAAMSDSRNSGISNIQQVNQNMPITDYSTDHFNCAVSNRFDELASGGEQRSHNEHTDTDVHSHFGSESRTEIPVVISRRENGRVRSRPQSRHNVRQRTRIQQSEQQLDIDMANDVADVDNDDDFVTHVRRRTKRYYVGGFLPSISEKKIRNYASRRGVTLTWVNIHRYEQQNRAVIRVNVDSEFGYRLMEYGFWPKGVTCRPWFSKGHYENRYLNKSYDNRGRDTEFHSARADEQSTYRFHNSEDC
ncbi:MAG: hypothetical protein N0C90_22820 [Candidatus Thiodiazotropha endolucinida]|nr:hypothetical protein [Candidatus Thiodiazotropha taylori]MCW4264187.1 hypothetical protein [Candidatus Thiodiazotropha endolucinida]